MKKEFERFPKAIQKQILLRLGFAAAFVLIFIVLLATTTDIYAVLPAIAMVLFCGITAFRLFLRAAARDYVVVHGYCDEVGKTLLSRRVKTIYIKTEDYTLQISPWHRPRRITPGVEIVLFLAPGTPVFERNGIQVVPSYLAMEVKGKVEENG